jgi:pimeloyl-ACP methyl ester carboxylesterase
MLEKMKGNILFTRLLKRPDINKAYAMVKPTDSWYDTITKVHNSLAQIQKMPHDVLEIVSHDQIRLKGMYYPCGKNSNVTVICIHGYTSHAEREWAFPGLFYLSLGYNVLIPYQRAHGLSGGKYISLGALERVDMLGWVDKINELNPDGSIIIHGLSMGGGIALDLCAKEMKNVKAIISDAPSESVKGMFEGIASHVFKKDSEKIAACVIARFEKEFGVDIMDLERVEVVSNSKYPLLLSAGSNEHCEELFALIKSRNPSPTEIIILPGCNHGNGMYKQTELYQGVIRKFIQSAI